MKVAKLPLIKVALVKVHSKGQQKERIILDYREIKVLYCQLVVTVTHFVTKLHNKSLAVDALS